MVNVLSPVISAWRKFRAKRFTVHTTLYLKDKCVESYPIMVYDQVYTEPLKQKPIVWLSHGPDAPWYYPLIGTLYTHRESGMAVFMSSGPKQAAIEYFEGILNMHNALIDHVVLRDIDSHIVLSNGSIVTPEEGARIQNRIRLIMIKFKMHPYDRRFDHYIDNDIEHEMMQKYLERFVPKETIAPKPVNGFRQFKTT